MDARDGNTHIDSGKKARRKTPTAPSKTVTAPGWHVERSDYFRAPSGLNQSTTCDTVIIGGGIVGLALAYHLSQHQNVVLLEAKEIGSGSSGWNAGVLSLSTTLDLAVLGKIVGRKKAQLLASSLTACLDETRASLGVDREVWHSGRSLFAAAKKPHQKLLDEEHEVQQSYGFASTPIGKQALASYWKGFSSALALEHEHAVHPYRLLLALAKAAEERGARLFENTLAKKWTADEDGATVDIAGSHTVRAKNIVVATGVAGLDQHFESRIKTRSVPVTGQVLVTQPSAHVRDMIAATGAVALWDSLKFYHYVHYLPDGRMLVGGADAPGKRTSTLFSPNDAALKKLWDWAAKHHSFPVPEVESAWRASFIYPLDGLPLISTKQVGKTHVIHAVTDGLPFGLFLGKAMTDILSSTGEKRSSQAIRVLEERQAPQGAMGIVSMLPDNATVRDLVVRIGMLGFKLQDLVA